MIVTEIEGEDEYDGRQLELKKKMLLYQTTFI
jgi:hypothetical protein